ncbi:phosphoribosyltransferase [Ramlibacter rhizophilus]|uniref:Phosphoribosyltransferase n=1 Tax=Ramlibacter rhizophilus TaxID=1781167 RepID=A0A4Z0C1R7_9BURK|nr:phosphoribosyltransferase family protein [Ramlibacter rhizophilus]TFZ04882.1 phosphoribosyltransferase [Ramlibacter rhizophilus]
MSLQDRLPLRDRRQAGELLAAELDVLRGTSDLIVLGLPRGGVPVAWEIARALHAPMDVFVVRKIGLPSHPEFAIGAIASGGIQVLDPVPARLARPVDVERVIEREHEELRRREQVYRPDMPPLDLHGRTVLLVDDGVATGATLEAAVRAVRKLQAGRGQVVVAAPVGSASAAARLRPLVDLLVFGAEPEPFGAVGVWYRDFPQCTDDEVLALLARARSAEALES